VARLACTPRAPGPSQLLPKRAARPSHGDPTTIKELLRDLLVSAKAGQFEASLLLAQIADAQIFAAQFERPEDVNYVANAVFDADGGILPLIRVLAEHNRAAAAKNKTLPKCVVKLLEFAGDVTGRLRHLGNSDLQHAALMVTQLEGLARKDKQGTDVQKTALRVATEVIQSLGGASEEARAKCEQDIGAKAMLARGNDALFDTKITASVQAGRMRFLGALVEQYPALVIVGSEGEEIQKGLWKNFLGALKREMGAEPRKRKQANVEGALEAISSMLVHIPQTAGVSAPKGSHGNAVVKHVMTIINPENVDNMSRWGALRAALQLLARHAAQFSEALGQYHEKLHEYLTACCRMKNREVKRDAFKALEAFLREVSAYIVAQHEDGETDDAERTFKFLFQQFVDMMQARDGAAASQSVSIAIRGFGYLAPPCRMLMADADLDKMFSFISKSCEKIYTSNADASEEAMMHLPSYITSVAKILREMSAIAGSYLFVLERLVVILCDHLPKMYAKMRLSAYHALIDVCVGLYPKEEVLEEVWGRICYQVLRSACTVTLTTSPEERYDHADIYVELFKKLLSDTLLAQREPNFTPADQANLHSVIYGEIVKNILAIVGQLNLKTRDHDESAAAGTASDLATGKDPENADDWSVIAMLTDFTVRFLKATKPAFFATWIPVVVDRIIRLWAQPGYELVGGFYRLLQLCVEVGDDIGFFDPRDADAATHGRASRHCVSKLKEFVRGLHGLFRQFNDDLLASSVCFVLSLPKPFFEGSLELFVPAVKIALKTGLGNSVLADAALDALERWITALPFSKLEPHLAGVLELVEVRHTPTPSELALFF